MYIYVYIPCHKVPWCSRINRNILIQVWISNVCVSYNIYIYTSYSLLYLFSRQKLPLGETAQAAHPTCSWKTQCIYFEPRSQVKIVGLLTYSFMRQNVSPQMSFFQLIHRVKPWHVRNFQNIFKVSEEDSPTFHPPGENCQRMWKKRSLPDPLLENHTPKPPDAMRALSMGGGAGSWQYSWIPFFWPQDELLDLHLGWVSNHYRPQIIEIY